MIPIDAVKQLRVALARLLESYEADVQIAPDMAVRVSWDTNFTSIERAREALEDTRYLTITVPCRGGRSTAEGLR